MNESTTDIPIVPPPEGRDVSTEALRDGARRVPAPAVGAEVAAWTGAICKGIASDSVSHLEVTREARAVPRVRRPASNPRPGSPRLHEPEDHPEVGDSRVRHRRREAGQEIPVVAHVRAEAGGRRHAGPVPVEPATRAGGVARFGPADPHFDVSKRSTHSR